MTCVLALDISKTRTGWALGGGVMKRPEWGVFETVNWEGRQGQNLSMFRTFIGERLRYARVNGSEVTDIAIEEIFVDVRGGDAPRFQYRGTEGQFMFASQALQLADENNIQAHRIEINDWRKEFLGLNRKPKDAKGDDKYWKNLAMRVCADRNWYVTHHDEAEALGIWFYTMTALNREFAISHAGHRNKQERDLDFKRGIHG